MPQNDVIRRIKIILETPRGSVPHHPKFGSDLYQYVDLCANLAKPKIVAETFRSLKAGLPEFKISKIQSFYLEQEEKTVIKINGIYREKKLEAVYETA